MTPDILNNISLIFFILSLLLNAVSFRNYNLAESALDTNSKTVEKIEEATRKMDKAYERLINYKNSS